MAKPSRPKAREIVCDGLSGLTNPIPPTVASEGIVIGAELIKARKQFPGAIDGYYNYIVGRLQQGGGKVWFGPDRLAFPDPGMTIGDLIDIVIQYTT